MANEITASAQLSASKNGVTLNNSVSLTVQASKDMAGDQMTQNVQIIGTSAEALDVGDVSTIGYVLIKNLDSTNFVELALDSGVSTQKFAKLRAGDFAVFPASTATIYAKADTSPCNCLVMAIEL